MRIKNLIKVLGIITSLFLLPSISNAQIQRVWNVPEFLSTMPAPPSAGAKIGFRTINNSVYYWNGSAWVRMAGPGIVDTTYSLSFTSPTLSLLGSGSSVSLTNLYTAGYGLIKTGETWRVDTTSPNGLATRLFANSNFFPLQGGTMTGTGGAGFVGFPSQVVAPGTPASGLNVYAQGSSFNWKGTDGFERLFASTLTGGRTYTLPDVSGTFALGTGTTNRVPLWTATNTLGNSNIQDNGTAVSILNSKPFFLGQWTTAGRPTGVNGYTGFNTSFNWLDIYSSSGWFSPARAATTGGAFTAGYIPFGGTGGLTESQYLTYTGTRFQTGGTIRFGRDNSLTDTAQIEKVTDGNSRIVRINNPGASGGWNGGFVFRGGQGGVLATAITFRVYTASSSTSGSVFVGNITDASAQSANATTNLGVLNKITSTNTYDTGINIHPQGNPNNLVAYSLSNGKHFGIFIGGQGGNNNLQSMSDVGYGVFAGYQRQPLSNGYASSWVFVAKDDASTPVELLRLQGKDGNICLGCTNAQYKLYTTSTDAYGLPRGTVAQRPTIIASTTPFRYNTDSTALEYGESVGTWQQIATRAYARSLFASAGTVTSVGLSLPSIFSVSGSPVTTSGTLSATFTGGTSSLFLRGDGRWMKSIYFNSTDSVEFGATDPFFGGTALISLKGTTGSFDSRFNVADIGYINHTLAIDTQDDPRYNFDRSRGTTVSPTALTKNDRVGGIYFRPHNGSSYRKAGYIGAIVDTVLGSNIGTKLIFGVSQANSPETSSYWQFIVKEFRNISIREHTFGGRVGIGIAGGIALETATIEARLHVKGEGTTTGKTMLLEDSGGNDILTVTDNKLIQTHGYGTGTKEAADLSKTQSNYIAGFATDGTVLDLERKRDTTVYVVDTDLDWSSAITTAQIASRYNRVIFLMTTTGAAGSNSDLTLHTPDVNLMQCEYLIRSTDEAGGFTNVLKFGTNNAVQSDNALTDTYTPTPGQGVGIRAGLRSGVYKYFYY